MVAKKTKIQKYLFIDTDVFLHAIFHLEDITIIGDLIKKLDEEFILVLPEIIKREVLYKFEEIKDGFIKEVDSKLSTKNILGIKEPNTKDSEDKQKDKNKTFAITSIDNFIDKDRSNLKSGIVKYYAKISDNLNEIIRHKNTKEIKLNTNLITLGTKRSLLKIAPFTKEKTGESAHTRDSDCIAFESLLFFLSKKKKNSSLVIMCVKDKDYCIEEGGLRKEIIDDLSVIISDIQCYQNLPDLLYNNSSTSQVKNILPTQTK